MKWLRVVKIVPSFCNEVKNEINVEKFTMKLCLLSLCFDTDGRVTSTIKKKEIATLIT